MTESLSAASLVLAVLAVILGMWHPDIVRALQERPKVHSADNAKAYRGISSVLWYKAIPLTVASISYLLVFATDVVGIAIGSINNLKENGAASVKDYDSQQGAFLLVYCFTLVITVHITLRSLRLKQHMRKFGSPNPKRQKQKDEYNARLWKANLGERDL